MNKKILIYIALVIIAVIIIAPYLSKDEKAETQAPTQTETKRTVSTSKCDKLNEGEDKWQCYKALAEEEREVEVCEKISDKLFREDCYYVVGFVTNDISLCDKITYDVQRNFCIQNFEDWKNEDCVELEWHEVLESSCLRNVGIMNNDLEICQRIKIQSYKDSCIKHVTLNIQ